MDLQQLVHASEILDNLEQIENQIQNQNKRLSNDGIKRIDEIIKECRDALRVSCDCGNKGRQEFERINKTKDGTNVTYRFEWVIHYSHEKEMLKFILNGTNIELLMVEQVAMWNVDTG